MVRRYEGRFINQHGFYVCRLTDNRRQECEGGGEGKNEREDKKYKKMWRGREAGREMEGRREMEGARKKEKERRRESNGRQEL